MPSASDPSFEPFDPVTGACRLVTTKACTVTIPAREKWVSTGVYVTKGERYRLSATGQWTDNGHESGPAGNDRPTWPMKLVKRLLRVPHARYFALIGSVGRDLKHAFVIGTAHELKVERSGVLLCFANDLHGFYWNNRGSVLVTIQRID